MASKKLATFHKTKHYPETVTMQEEGEFTEMTFSRREGFTKVIFRNVGDRNQEGSIQFSVEKHTKGKHSQYASFDIPLEMADLFVERLKKIR